MKRIVIVVLAASSCAFAQKPNVTDQERGNVIYQTSGSLSAGVADEFERASRPMVGAPYSATITNESIQTLADGNRIVQRSTGTTARDSEGRTRRETALPAIGNLSAANAPHLVFIHDPVTQTSYTLNLTEKTAQKVQMLSVFAGEGAGATAGLFTMRVAGPLPQPDAMPPAVPAGTVGVPFEKQVVAAEQDQVSTEDLGSKTMEGVVANGVRTTHTIPAGQVGNERPITIITEVWTSPDLKTVVFSKRNDPRMGEQIFRLTNVVRTEPSPSLFTVPPDFKIVDGPQTILYRAKQ